MRCPYCHHDVRLSGQFCPRCGRQVLGLPETSAAPAPAATPQPPRPVTPDPKPMLASRHVIGKTCPYDQYPISTGDEVVICPECATPHHPDCWAENGGCTTYGCAHSPAAKEAAARAAAAIPHPNYPPAHARVRGPRAHSVPLDASRDAVKMVMVAEIEQRASNAFIYTLIGLPCCPVLSVIGFFMAVSVLATLSRVNVDSEPARMKVTWALVVAAIGVVVWIVALLWLGETSGTGNFG